MADGRFLAISRRLISRSTQESFVKGYKVISSGTTDSHSSGVWLILSGEAQRALISYNPLSDRII